MTDITDHIRQTVDQNDVVLFMKGTPEMPQCGFSSKVSQILGYVGVPYSGVNVLESDALRQGIKDFSDWPTIRSSTSRASSWAAATSSSR